MCRTAGVPEVRLAHRRPGQTLVELALLLGLVGMLALGTGSLVVPQLHNHLSKITCALGVAQGSDAGLAPTGCSQAMVDEQVRTISAKGGPRELGGRSGCSVAASDPNCRAATSHSWSPAGLGWSLLIILVAVAAVIARRAGAGSRKSWS